MSATELRAAVEDPPDRSVCRVVAAEVRLHAAAVELVLLDTTVSAGIRRAVEHAVGVLYAAAARRCAGTCSACILAVARRRTSSS